MICRIQCVVLLLLAVLPATLRAGDTIERVVVVVNGRPILLSEWDAAVQREALLAAKPIASSEEDRHAVLERLIDQELLRSEMERSTFQRAIAQEVGQKLQELRKAFPEVQSESDWNAVLAKYGVSSQELQAAIGFQIDALRLIDLRLRPSAQPDQGSIEAYYRTTYLPSVRKAGGKPQALNQVSGNMKEILIQQKLGDLTTAWLQSLRSQADVRWIAEKP
jgi:hypothetical protein